MCDVTICQLRLRKLLPLLPAFHMHNLSLEDTHYTRYFDMLGHCVHCSIMNVSGYLTVALWF